MKASTWVGVALAVLAGLAAALLIRSGAPPEKPAAVPDIARAEKPEPIVLVLIAKRNLPKGMMVTAGDVTVKPASPEELAAIGAKRTNLLPPYPEAVDWRAAARDLNPGDILYKDDLVEPAPPVPLARKLDAGMVPVSLALPKERAAGGLLEVGDFVDVYVTTTICTESLTPGSAPTQCGETVTAPLANHLKIVAKNDVYILQASPYRAAVIELARAKGLISLHPDASPAKDRISKAEKEREAAFQPGQSSVSEDDLALALHLPALDMTPTPQARNAPAIASVEQVRGVSPIAPTGFAASGAEAAPMAPAPRRYRFFMPTSAPATPAR